MSCRSPFPGFLSPPSPRIRAVVPRLRDGVAAGGRMNSARTIPLWSSPDELPCPIQRVADRRALPPGSGDFPPMKEIPKCVH